MTNTQTLNNRYLLEAELDRGGMGVVYRARDLSLNRIVAVKVLPPEFTIDQQFLQRFRNEVLNVAKLDHPNIVQIYDVGQDGSTHFYVMQLVEGSNLHDEVLNRGRFQLNDAFGIVAQIASALDYAHKRGIVHRDIKPDNILLDLSGTVRIIDFGIAKSVEGTRMTGGMIGTPEYMSPEQARGEALDGRADQYALAIVVYEMLTGTTPFRGSDTQPWALVNMHITVAPPDPRQYQRDLPEHVVQALSYGLAKNPTERFPTCTEFSGYLSSGSVSAPPIKATSVPAYIPAFTPAAKPIQAKQIQSANRYPLVVALVVLLVMGMVAVGISLVVMSNRSSNTATSTTPAIVIVEPPVVVPPIPPTVPTPPVVPVLPVSDTVIYNFVEMWKSSWSNKALDTYSNCYDPGTFEGVNYSTHTGEKQMNYDEWMNDKRKKFAGTNGIAVELNDPIIESNANSQVVISFNQQYRSNSYEDYGRKTLVLAQQPDGSLKIINETFRQQ